MIRTDAILPPTAREDIAEHFERRGFCQISDIWTASECDDLIEAAHSLREESKADFRPIIQPHRRHPAFMNAIRNPRVVEIIGPLLNSDVTGLQTEMFFGAPGTLGRNLHQDNFFVETESNHFISVWSALTDVSSDNGSLYILPGTHVLGVLPTQATERPESFNQDINAHNEVVLVPDGYEEFDIEIPKGSIVLLHSDVVHGTRPNISNEYRYAFLASYIRPSARFRPGLTAQRKAFSLTDDQN